MNDLDQLTHLADQADAGAIEIDAAARGPELDGEGNPVVVAPPTDYQREAAGCVDMFAALVVGFAPKAAPIWSPEAKERTAMALAPVLEKYGFTFGNMPPELTLAIVAGPLLWQTSRVVAEQINEQRRKEGAQAIAAQVAPHAERDPAPESGNGPQVVEHAQMGLYKTAAQP